MRALRIPLLLLVSCADNAARERPMVVAPATAKPPTSASPNVSVSPLEAQLVKHCSRCHTDGTPPRLGSGAVPNGDVAARAARAIATGRMPLGGNLDDETKATFVTALCARAAEDPFCRQPGDPLRAAVRPSELARELSRESSVAMTDEGRGWLIGLAGDDRQVYYSFNYDMGLLMLASSACAKQSTPTKRRACYGTVFDPDRILLPAEPTIERSPPGR